MGNNTSSAFTGSTQDISQNLAQTFKGDCNVVCDNTISGVDVTIKDSKVSGGLNFNQSCTANVDCLINSYSTATADALLKNLQKSTAKNAGTVLSGSWLSPFGQDSDYATALSSQNIRQNISQLTETKCGSTSMNNLEKVKIVVTGSSLAGGINMDQTGDAKGNCNLTNKMDAALKATESNDQTAMSGKDKKGDKFSMMKWLGLFAAIVAIMGIIAMMVSSSSNKGAEKDAIRDYAEAMASTLCPGGAMRNSDGNVILNPFTGDVVCAKN